VIISTPFWLDALFVNFVLGCFLASHMLNHLNSIPTGSSSSRNIIVRMISSSGSFSTKNSTFQELIDKGRDELNQLAKRAIKGHILKNIAFAFVAAISSTILLYLLDKGGVYISLWGITCVGTMYFVSEVVIGIVGIRLFRQCSNGELNQFFDDHDKEGTLALAHYLNRKDDECLSIDIHFIAVLLSQRALDKEKNRGKKELREGCRVVEGKDIS